MGRDRDELTKTITAALPVALLLPVVGVLALRVRSPALGDRFSTSAAFAVLTGSFLALAILLSRRRRPRAGVLAAVHGMAWVPLIAIGAWRSLTTEIVFDRTLRCGTGMMGMLKFGLPIAVIGTVIGGILVGATFVQRETDRVIRRMAIGLTGLVLVGFAFALAHVARPDGDTFLDSLTTVGEVSVGHDAVLAGRSFHYERVVVVDHAPPLGDGFDPAAFPRRECHLFGLSEMETYFPGDGPCTPVRVRVEPGQDLAVLGPADPRGCGALAAFRPSDGVTGSISPVSLAGRIGPPIGWTVGAGIAGAIALGFLFMARRVRRQVAVLEGIEAIHEHDGWVRLQAGETLRVPVAERLPLGPVVLGQIEEPLPAYRTAAATRFGVAWAGTLEDLRAARCDLVASLESAAAATAALGAAPLIVARILGVL